MPEITFQKATMEDLDIYVELEKSVSNSKIYRSVTDKDKARKWMENNEVYFIKKDGVIVGSTDYRMENPNYAHLGGLVIDPKFQGQGIARKAIEFRLNKLKDVKRIDLVTHPHNSKIIGLYLSYGFIIEAWKDNHFGDGEPRIVLARELQK